MLGVLSYVTGLAGLEASKPGLCVRGEPNRMVAILKGDQDAVPPLNFVYRFWCGTQPPALAFAV
jgi:hypothetical protein